MKHRLISYPEAFPNEVALINQLFEAGLECFHLRKPNWELKTYQKLLSSIEEQYHQKIILHQFHALQAEFNVKGLHLTESKRIGKLKNKELNPFFEHHTNLELGTSCHKPDYLNTLNPKFNYTFVSPVFPSISKQNYEPKYNWEINTLNFDFSVIALGGINTSNIGKAKQKGFQEVAFLGAVWDTPEMVLHNYNVICKTINGLML